ncbi:MAG: hypothetical protein AAF497_25050, partial [Planctomycetota bacterium]
MDFLSIAKIFNRRQPDSSKTKTRRKRLDRRPRLLSEQLEDRRMLATFTVTNTNDSGPGSVRDALAQADANPGADNVVF